MASGTGAVTPDVCTSTDILLKTSISFSCRAAAAAVIGADVGALVATLPFANIF